MWLSSTSAEGFHIGEAIYFVTWRIAKAQAGLAAGEPDVVAAALKHWAGKRYQLATFVVMNDRVHALLSPIAPHRLEEVIDSFKSFAANRMQRDRSRRGAVWQDEYFDRIVRDEKEFRQKFDYIQHNPWTRWPQLEAYNWVWPLSD